MRYDIPRGITPKLLPLCIAGAMAGLSPTAVQAVTMLSATGEYSLGGVLPTTIASDTSADTTVDPSVDIIPYVTDASGNSIFFHVYGNAGNVFGSRSSGEGLFTAEGTFLLTEDFNAGAGGEFFLDFTVDSGTIRTQCSSAMTNCETGQGGSASYSISIKVDGTEVAKSTASVAVSDSANGTVTGPAGGEFVLNGVAQGTTAQSAFYSWNTSNFIQSLGVLGAGDHTLTYELVTTAIGDFGTGGGVCYGSGGGELEAFGAAVTGGTGSCTSGSSEARSGDPFNIVGPSTSNRSNTIVTGLPPGPGGGGISAAVPEPETIALLAGGVVAVGFARRRKAQRQPG